MLLLYQHYENTMKSLFFIKTGLFSQDLLFFPAFGQCFQEFFFYKSLLFNYLKLVVPPLTTTMGFFPYYFASTYVPPAMEGGWPKKKQFLKHSKNKFYGKTKKAAEKTKDHSRS